MTISILQATLQAADRLDAARRVLIKHQENKALNEHGLAITQAQVEQGLVGDDIKKLGPNATAQERQLLLLREENAAYRIVARAVIYGQTSCRQADATVQYLADRVAILRDALRAGVLDVPEAWLAEPDVAPPNTVPEAPRPTALADGTWQDAALVAIEQLAAAHPDWYWVANGDSLRIRAQPKLEPSSAEV